ncbi:YdcF family protein [Zongyangia hominis]|uniref:YdcF family protein n=1 Tax=Zongyangia hominis TaxID=2763677 RepID=A0A926I5U9_9FIRM|nr:YdcF family protein [Zongyangia hominis]MBC8569279.1 YdcF family protein [Zongyangia hominis]
MFSKILRGVIGVLGAFCLVFSLIPMLIYGIFNIGAILLFPAGALLLGLMFFWEKIAAWHRSSRGRWTRRLFDAAAILCGAGCICVLGVIAMMIHAAYLTPPNEAQTVVVLGCLVRGDSPSRMLQGRLDRALSYLQDHPDAVCVVSGGQGPNEDYTEAHVMAQYLIGRGVDPARIYQEADSSDTQENLAYSARLIRREGLSTQVAVVTDDFHMFRSLYRAREAGLSPSGLSSLPPWGLLPCYWLREVFAIGELVLEAL